MFSVKMILGFLVVLFLLIHECDAFYTQEWRMLKFLRGMQDRSQYAIFLYGHIPYIGILLYYLMTMAPRDYGVFDYAISGFALGHCGLHWVATTWKSNVFKNANSWIGIAGAGLFALVNLINAMIQ